MLIVYVNPVAVYSFIIDHQKPYLFFKLQYVNKEIDAVNISYILNHKKVQSCVPQCFLKFILCISYNYTWTFQLQNKRFNASILSI